MIEAFVLGAIQGIAEWLPVSSEGLIVLAKINLFGSTESLADLVSIAVFLHLGTFFAALIYFWKDVRELVLRMFKPEETSLETKSMFRFLLIATIVSGLLGAFLLWLTERFGENIFIGTTLTVLVGALLLVTGFLQIKTKRLTDGGAIHARNENGLNDRDAIVTGIAQGFAALPGLSRSGLTIATLLLRRFGEESALRISFLMSLPIVLAGNVILNFRDFTFSNEMLLALVTSFVFGLATIHLLFKIAKKVNFGWFVIGFGVIMILTSFV